MNNIYEIDRLAPFTLVINNSGEVYAESYEDAKDFLESIYEGEAITFPSAFRKLTEKYKEVHIIQSEHHKEKLLETNPNRFAIEEALKRV